VGDGHQGPFPVHLLQPPQQEAIQAPCPFDLTKHRLNDGLAQGVDRLAGLGADLAVHPAPCIQIPGCWPPRGPWPFAVLLAAGGEVGIQPALLARLDVACAAVARVGDQLLGQLAGVGHDLLQHGNEVVLARGLVADPHRHDDLVVAIDRRLAVVALNLAVPTFEDVTAGVLEIAHSLWVIK
jgi:hypothetical protein